MTAVCREKTRGQNMDGFKCQNNRLKMRILAGQNGYPLYPHFPFPPKVEAKTLENQGVFNFVHKLCTKLSTFGISYPQGREIRVSSKKGQNFHTSIVYHKRTEKETCVIKS